VKIKINRNGLIYNIFNKGVKIDLFKIDGKYITLLIIIQIILLCINLVGFYKITPAIYDSIKALDFVTISFMIFRIFNDLLSLLTIDIILLLFIIVVYRENKKIAIKPLTLIEKKHI
jgi:hypothetical protein